MNRILKNYNTACYRVEIIWIVCLSGQTTCSSLAFDSLHSPMLSESDDYCFFALLNDTFRHLASSLNLSCEL